MLAAIASSLVRVGIGVLCIGLALPRVLGADEIRVAVASNFRLAMGDAAAMFERDSGHRVVLIFGSTGKQYAQILNGAPFDAFFAADAERPQLLEREGLALPGSRFTYAVGQLVLWSADESLIDEDGRVLAAERFHHLAIANPELAPYGAAARAVLGALGLWEQVRPKLVRGENIGQAFQFVVSGNAELGFVARSQLATPGYASGGSSWTPPQSLYPPIEQQAVLLRDSGAGRAFMAFMQSDRIAGILRDYGYDAPR